MSPTLAECLDRPRNDLAAVRILAAVAVLHAHAWLVVTPNWRTGDFWHVFGFSLDWHGVHAFFILSGMLLTKSLIDRPDPLRFTVARLMRYIPAIFVAALFAALVIGPLVTRMPLADYFKGGLVEFVLKTTTLSDVTAPLPGVFETHPMPGILFIPLWTIHYELVFALVLAVAGALGLIRLKALVAIGLVLTLAVNIVWFWNGEEHVGLGSVHHLVRFASAFGIGIALAVFADRIPVSNKIMLALILISIPLAYSHVASLAGMVLIAYAILCIGFAGGSITAWLAKLGVWSYGFYVWGYLIEQTIFHTAPSWSGWSVFALAFVLALFAGWFSWTFVEKPSIAQTRAISNGLRRIYGRLRGDGETEHRVGPPTRIARD